jgi:hypothetical protein
VIQLAFPSSVTQFKLRAAGSRRYSGNRGGLPMLRILAITLLALAGVSAAHADVYRWVDSNGVVQYSDRWVPGSVLVKQDKSRPASSSDAPAPAAANAPAAAVPRADEVLARERDQRTVAADIEKVRGEQCKKAREAYDYAVNTPRLYKPDKDGGKIYLSDAELSARRVELLNKRREFCGS